MALLKLCKGNVTAGLTDGDLVSTGTGLAPVTPDVLNATLSEVGDPMKLAIRCEVDYETVGDITIQAVGPNANMWRFASDDNDTPGTFSAYGGVLTISELVDDTNTIIWAQVRAFDTETAHIDTDVNINIIASVRVQETV